jgi:hypothetical protein
MGGFLARGKFAALWTQQRVGSTWANEGRIHGGGIGRWIKVAFINETQETAAHARKKQAEALAA